MEGNDVLCIPVFFTVIGHQTFNPALQKRNKKSPESADFIVKRKSLSNLPPFHPVKRKEPANKAGAFQIQQPNLYDSGDVRKMSIVSSFPSRHSISLFFC